MAMSETKIVFGLADVMRVRLQCQQCGNEIAIRTDRIQDYHPKENCPLCNAEWLSRNATEHIKNMIHDFKYLQTEKVNLSVEIEIDAPKG